MSSSDTKTPRERAEALFQVRPYADGFVVCDASEPGVMRRWYLDEATALAHRAELAAPIAAALEAAARDATEAAAAVCDRIMAHEDRAALKAREALEFEARDRHWHRRDAAHECGWAIRKGDTGGEHGQR